MGFFSRLFGSLLPDISGIPIMGAASLVVGKLVIFPENLHLIKL
jgi:hypothetical protein